MAASELVVAHCDWGAHPGKQWLALGRVDAGGAAVAGAPEPVGDATTLLDRLRRRAEGAAVVAGFDFPIGLPHAYAALVGVESFPGFLRTLAAGHRPQLFEVAVHPSDISVHRPFYPAVASGSKQRHLLDALGVEGMDSLRRHCERRSGRRRAAMPLFWLVGAAQVGKAALSGWRDVLLPAVRPGSKVGLWPFDGELAALLATREAVLVESYPAEFAEHLHAHPGRGGKTRHSGREPACAALAAAVDRLEVKLTDQARRQLERSFGDRPDGEDRFDAFVGLLGMLNVLLGGRSPGPPPTIPQHVLAVEGWILGQATYGPGVARAGAAPPAGSGPAPPASTCPPFSGGPDGPPSSGTASPR